MKTVLFPLAGFLVVLVVPSTLIGQLDDEPETGNLRARVAQVESELSELEAETQEHGAKIRQLDSLVEHADEVGLGMWLFGAFCALWAQNTGRSAWLWFFLGGIFSVITVLFLLHKNSKDIAQRGQTGL